MKQWVCTSRISAAHFASAVNVIVRVIANALRGTRARSSRARRSLRRNETLDFSSLGTFRNALAALSSTIMVTLAACTDQESPSQDDAVYVATANSAEDALSLWYSSPTQRLAFSEIHISSAQAQSVDITWRSTFTRIGVGPTVMTDGQPIEVLQHSKPGQHRSTVRLPLGSHHYVFRDGPRTINGDYAQVERITMLDGQLDRPERPARRLVALGDSILCGFNADRPAVDGYAMLLRGALSNWQMSTMASGGYGLYSGGATRAQRVALADELVQCMDGTESNLLLLAIGVNDHNSYFWSDAAEFGAGYSELLDLLHERAPDALILCMTPFLKYPDQSVSDFRQQIALAVSARSGYTRLIDGTGVQPEMDEDGLHPTTTGNQTIFNWLLPILRSHGVQ